MKKAEGIFCAGVDHHATPLDLREALVAAAGSRVIPHCIEYGGAEELVFLSTCNRVEIYGRSERRGPEMVAELVRAMPDGLGKVWEEARGMYLHEGLACWRHLAEVATGLRSMVIGEGEILGQVRGAYGLARECGGTGSSMHRLFQSALRAARAARAVAGFGKGDASVGKLAAEALQDFLGKAESRPLLLLGSGHTARSFALAEKEFSKRPIWISSRSGERAQALAIELGGEVVDWAKWPEAVRAAAVVVSALAGGELAWAGEEEKGGPSFFVDLGVPRTLTAVRRSFPSAGWLDLEELAKRSEVEPEALGSIHRAEEVLRNHEALFLFGRGKVIGSTPIEGR